MRRPIARRNRFGSHISFPSFAPEMIEVLFPEMPLPGLLTATPTQFGELPYGEMLQPHEDDPGHEHQHRQHEDRIADAAAPDRGPDEVRERGPVVAHLR